MIETIGRLIQNKKVLLLGLGREGRSTLHLLQKVGGYRSITVADRNPVTLPDGADCTLLSGPDYQKTLDEYDLVIKSPGIVLERPYESYCCLITSQVELFLSVYGRQTIGITGTKGKSTTTTLLYHVLKENAVNCVMMGNIGIPPFDCLDDITPQTVVVMELSCHQLEYTRFSPHIGVLLNVFEEHLDHYGTFEKYRAAKENIYRFQQKGDFLYCHQPDLPVDGTCAAKVFSLSGDDTPADVQIVGNKVMLSDGGEYLIPTEGVRLLGQHNAFDIGVVYAICARSGISDDRFTAALKTYEPLPHRLQPVGEKRGIRFFNDSISTIGETAIQALETLPDTDTILIGGMDRGVDYAELIRYLSDSPVKHILLMEETGRRIYKEAMALPVKSPERFQMTENLKDAVQKAAEITAPGKICLLSPAAASYGIFRDFIERGEVFCRYVEEL